MNKEYIEKNIVNCFTSELVQVIAAYEAWKEVDDSLVSPYPKYYVDSAIEELNRRIPMKMID